MMKQVSGWMLSLVVLVTVVSSAHGQTITEDMKVQPSDASWGSFGIAMDYDDGLFVVGDFSDGEQGPSAGAAYLVDATTGDILTKLLPDTFAPYLNRNFGRQVAIDNGIVAVSSPGEDNRIGAVYLFDAMTGDQLVRIQPDDGLSSDSFGLRGIAMKNGRLAVCSESQFPGGHIGAVYLYDVATAGLLTKITQAVDPSQGLFGSSVSMDDSLIAVGAFALPWNNFPDSVATVTLFDLDGNFVREIVEPVPGSRDGFGEAVSIEGDVVVASRDHEREVYIYHAPTGALVHTIEPFDLLNTAEFGKSLTISGGILAVGAPQSYVDGVHRSGMVYLYDTASGAAIWRLVPSDIGNSKYFGSSTAFGDNVVLCGAYQDSSAYWFNMGFDCPVDYVEDLRQDIFDVFAFLDLFSAQDPAADFTNDGTWDVFDVFAFIDIYQSTCQNAAP